MCRTVLRLYCTSGESDIVHSKFPNGSIKNMHNYLVKA